MRGSKEIVEILLEKRPDTDLKDKVGKNAIDLGKQDCLSEKF